MAAHPRAGQPAEPSDLVDIARLVTAYYTEHPDAADPAQQVLFGTSGHRGSAFDRAFNDDHIAATTQAICDYRRANFIGGPLFLGKDTHALSEPAYATALEVLAANEVTVLVDPSDRYTPTPALSLAILMHNEGRRSTDTARADGIVVTPSHNPPRDGGFKYNPPDGRPAGSYITGWEQHTAKDLQRDRMRGVMPVPLARCRTRDRGDLGREQAQQRPVLVGRPDLAVPAQEARAGRLLAAEPDRAVEQAGHEPLEADRHLDEPPADSLGDPIDHARADERLADGSVGRPAVARLEQVLDRHREEVVGVEQTAVGSDDAVPVRVGVVAGRDAVRRVVAAHRRDQRRHRVGRRAVHPDLAVGVQRHEPERRVDERVDHREVELVPLGDGRPLVDAGTPQWVPSEL
jgi:hypothetical protein